jgi:hypothetical protein
MSGDLRRTTIEFAVLVERMTRLLLATTHGLLSGVSLIQAKNSGEYPKTGRIADGEYSFHGSGCRLELDSGEFVDFDLSVHDEGSFDGFRLRSFVTSRSEEWNDAAASEVLADLVNLGVLVEPKPGWYRLA